MLDTAFSRNSLPSVPSVSVVVPAFNRAETIAVTLDSLVAQSFTDWEAIVIDDGSIDSTAAVVERYAVSDSRIRLLRQANAGVGAARNVGIEQSQGRWVFFLDADDWVTPDALALLVGAVDHEPEGTVAIARSVLVMPNGAEVVEDAPPPQDEMFQELARRCVYSIHAAIQPTELVRAVGGFDALLIAGEDWDLWQRIARTGPAYVYPPEKIAYYRVRPTSASRGALRLLQDGGRVIERGHAEDPRLAGWPGPLYPPPERSGVASSMVYLSAYCAGLAIGAGEDPTYLLDHVPSISRHDVDGRWLAETLFDSVAVGMCDTVSAWPSFPPEVHERVMAYIDGLAARDCDNILAVTTARAFEALLAQQLLESSGAPSANVGATHVVRAVLGAPIGDIRVSPLTERVLVELHESEPVPTAGVKSLGRDREVTGVTLPATGTVVPALVVADALADDVAWDLMGRLLDETVQDSLALARSDDSLVVGRGSLELGSAPLISGGFHDRADPRGGWIGAVLAGALGSAGSRHRRVLRGCRGGRRPEAPVLVVPAGAVARVEVAEQLPLISTEAETVVVQVGLAGLPFVALRIPSPEGKVTPQQIRRAINLEGKFELCQVAVREAVLQSQWPVGTPLRSRLSALAARRGQAAASRQAAGMAKLDAERDALLRSSFRQGTRPSSSAAGRVATSCRLPAGR